MSLLLFILLETGDIEQVNAYKTREQCESVISEYVPSGNIGLMCVQAI